MVHVRFDPSELRYESFFGQVGSGGIVDLNTLPLYQRGHGYFAGFPRQRGAGLGDVFRRFWRFLKPIAKSLAPVVTSAGKAIGEEGLATTARVLNDVVQGSSLKDAVANEGKEGVINLLGKAETKLKSQRGQGRKRKRNRQKAGGVIMKPHDPSLIGRLVPKKSVNTKKRRRMDAFGSY